VLGILKVVDVVLLIVAFVAILFTGKHPEGLYKFQVGRLRWNERVTMYYLLATDQ
jgi:hypothetical protein